MEAETLGKRVSGVQTSLTKKCFDHFFKNGVSIFSWPESNAATFIPAPVPASRDRPGLKRSWNDLGAQDQKYVKKKQHFFAVGWKRWDHKLTGDELPVWAHLLNWFGRPWTLITENAEHRILHYCTPWSKCTSKPNIENLKKFKWGLIIACKWVFYVRFPCTFWPGVQ